MKGKNFGFLYIIYNLLLLMQLELVWNLGRTGRQRFAIKYLRKFIHVGYNQVIDLYTTNREIS